MKSKLFFLFVVLAVIDQSAKYFISASVCNKNIAWNIPVAPVIFYLAWIPIILFLVYIFFKTKNYKQKIFLLLIFTGAVSNIIDRIRLGCVVDYIDLKFFPIFNLADIYITAGVILIILNMMRNKNTKH